MSLVVTPEHIQEVATTLAEVHAPSGRLTANELRAHTTLGDGVYEVIRTMLKRGYLLQDNGFIYLPPVGK